MYSNCQNYSPSRKPPLGALPNPYLSINRGLVGCWLFNEGAGDRSFDLSKNGNTGAFFADTHFAPGKFGPALDFDGTGDYVAVPHNSSLQLPAWTILAWIKTDTVIGNGCIISKGHHTVDYRNYQLSKNGNIFIGVYENVGGTDAVVVTSAGLVVDKWYCVVFTYENRVSKLYVDDVKVDEEAQTIDPKTSQTSDVHIGSYVLSNWDFDGLIDHAMIWNRALADSEIALLYRKPFCGFRWMSMDLSAVYLPAVPEIRALYMDLATQIWTIKHAKGLFTKL